MKRKKKSTNQCLLFLFLIFLHLYMITSFLEWTLYALSLFPPLLHLLCPLNKISVLALSVSLAHTATHHYHTMMHTNTLPNAYSQFKMKHLHVCKHTH